MRKESLANTVDIVLSGAEAHRISAVALRVLGRREAVGKFVVSREGEGYDA